jgi:hypothetical protein
MGERARLSQSVGRDCGSSWVQAFMMGVDAERVGAVDAVYANLCEHHRAEAESNEEHRAAAQRRAGRP